MGKKRGNISSVLCKFHVCTMFNILALIYDIVLNNDWHLFFIWEILIGLNVGQEPVLTDVRFVSVSPLNCSFQNRPFLPPSITIHIHHAWHFYVCWIFKTVMQETD